MATDKNRFSKRKNKKKTGITGTASNQRSATNSTGERRRNILVKITKKILKKILPKRLYSRLIGRVSNDIITLDSPDKSYNSIFLSDDEGSKMIVILNEKRRDSSASLLEDVRQISSTKDQDIFPPDQELPSQITISIKRNNAENAKELTQEIVKDFNSTKERDEQVQITKTEETTLDSELVGITISIQKQANLPQQREEQSLSDRLSVSVDQINNLSELKAKYEGVFKNTTPNNDTIKIDLKTNSDQLKLIQKERKELISKENPKQQELKRINEQLKADLPNRDNLILTKERLEADLLNDFDRQKDMLKKLKDNQNYLTKVDRIQKLGQENNSITPIGTLTPLIEKLKSDIGLIQEKEKLRHLNARR